MIGIDQGDGYDVPAEQRPVRHRPTPAIAHALFAQPGDVLTWGDEGDPNARYRWDGESWQPLQVGDVCRNTRDGSAMIWAGATAGWRKPLVHRMEVEELAAVIDPEISTLVDDQPRVDHAMFLAERILAYGYTHTLRAPAIQASIWHFPEVPYKVGDPVDVTWTNGRTTRHIIDEIHEDGSLRLRNRP
jgi:hypothetical protein